MARNNVVPVPSLPPPSLRAMFDTPPDRSELPQLEMDVVSYVMACDMKAKGNSLIQRGKFRDMLAAWYAEYSLPGGDSKQNSYFIPLLGILFTKLAQLVQADVIPDSQKLDFFTLQPPCNAYGYPPDPNLIYQENTAALGLELILRQTLKDAGFPEDSFRAMIDDFRFGNSFTMPMWEQEYGEETKGPDDILGEIQDLSEQEIFGEEVAEEIEPTRLFLTKNFPVMQRVDVRNIFPSSMQCDKGYAGLPWFTTYSTMSFRELVEGRVRIGDDGTRSGAFSNWDMFRPNDERLVPEIYYDMPWDNYSTNSAYNIDDDRLWTTTPALPVVTYIGCWHWENISGGNDGGKMPTAAAVNSLLKKFGNNPKACKQRRWWVAQVIDGILVRFQPWPYGNGNVCPIIQTRWDARDGRTYGEGVYKTSGAQDELYNFFSSLFVDVAERIGRPVWGIDKSQIDPEFLNNLEDSATLNTVPDGYIPLNANGNVSGALQPHAPPSQALSAISEAAGMLRQNVEVGTGVVPQLQGQASKSNTAAEAQIDQTNAQGIIGFHARRWEQQYIVPCIKAAIQLVSQFAAPEEVFMVRSQRDLARLADMDAETAEQLEQADAMKANIVMPFLKTIQTESFSANYGVEVSGVSRGGGRAARLQALMEVLQYSMQLEQVEPQKTNYTALKNRILRESGIDNPEEFTYTPQQQMANAQQRAEVGGVLSQGGEESADAAQSMGTPAPPKNFISAQ